jgi:hypothetical protein
MVDVVEVFCGDSTAVVWAEIFRTVLGMKQTLLAK